MTAARELRFPYVASLVLHAAFLLLAAWVAAQPRLRDLFATFPSLTPEADPVCFLVEARGMGGEDATLAVPVGNTTQRSDALPPALARARRGSIAKPPVQRASAPPDPAALIASLERVGHDTAFETPSESAREDRDLLFSTYDHRPGTQRGSTLGIGFVGLLGDHPCPGPPAQPTARPASSTTPTLSPPVPVPVPATTARAPRPPAPRPSTSATPPPPSHEEPYWRRFRFPRGGGSLPPCRR